MYKNRNQHFLHGYPFCPFRQFIVADTLMGCMLIDNIQIFSMTAYNKAFRYLPQRNYLLLPFFLIRNFKQSLAFNCRFFSAGKMGIHNFGWIDDRCILRPVITGRRTMPEIIRIYRMAF